MTVVTSSSTSRPPAGAGAATILETWLPEVFAGSHPQWEGSSPTLRLSLSGPGGGEWEMQIVDGQIQVARLLRSLGARRGQTFRFLVWPALLPALLSSLRIGTGTALAVLFFAETFGTNVGLGWFVMESWMRMSYVDMYAGILCLALLGLALFLAIDLIQRWACRWQDPG